MEEIREEIRITQINDDELFDEMPDIDDLEAEDGVSGSGGQADGWMYEEIMRTLDDMGKKAAEQDYYIDGHRVDAEYFLSDAEKVAVECQKKIKELQELGVHFSGCITCAEELGVVDEIRALGIDLVKWLNPLTELLKGNKKLLTV